MAKIELKNNVGKVIGTVDEAEWSRYSQEQKDNFLSTYNDPVAPKSLATVAQPTGDVEKQRLRAAAQGATFGLSDEGLAAMQAAAASMSGGQTFGEEYERALASERTKLKAYQQAYPVSSAAYEIGGAIIPSLIASAVTGGTATPGIVAAEAPLAARLGKAAMTGLGQGAAYGYGTGEGGYANRLQSAAYGAGAGAISAPALVGAGNLIRFGARSAIDKARQLFGNKAAGAVEAEIQRLAQENNVSPEEVISAVASGQIMAENRTLMTTIRKLYAEGGEAGATIKQALTPRPQGKRAEMMSEIEGYLADQPGNPLANARVSSEAARAAEDVAYAKAWQGMPTVDPAIESKLISIARMAPEAFKGAAKALKLSEEIDGAAATPFFREVEGNIEFIRTPTLQEAEMVYRTLRDAATASFKAGNNEIGLAYKKLRDSLKNSLDASSPELSTARTQAATVRNARDAFKVGQQSLGKSPDQIDLEIADITKLGDEAVKAYREGVLTALRAQSAGPRRASLPGRMESPEFTGGAALAAALPPGASTRVGPTIANAKAAQDAYSSIIGGSQTAATAMNTRGVGDVVNMGMEATGLLQGNIFSGLKLLEGVIAQKAPNLNQAQKAQVARILVSEDPEIVAKALGQKGGAAALKRAVDTAINTVTSATSRAAPVASTIGIQEITRNR